MNLLICFLAPSGYGKSTAIQLLQEDYDSQNFKIAEPLYELQTYFYQKIGVTIGNCQDGELLQFLGAKIRKEQPLYLVQVFKEKIQDALDKKDIITNDDCRPYDYKYLKEMGFIFIRINGYPRDRVDHTTINRALSIEWQSDIPFDYEINNTGSLEDYKSEIRKCLEEIKNDRKVLRYTSPKKVQL